MAAFKGAIGSKEKGTPTSTAGGGSLRAIALVLTAVAAVAVPILLLVRFHGQPMSQVWVMSVSICTDVFLFLLCICPTRSFCNNFNRLSYAPLLTYFFSGMIGSAAATLALLLSMVWAAGNLGYSLAVHRLRNGTEQATHGLPSPSFATKYNFDPYVGAPFVLLWTLVAALFVNFSSLTDELEILAILSYMGWIHVTCRLIFVALVPMTEFPLGEQIQLLAPALLLWTVVSPFICLVSQILAALCHLLLMMALVAFLWYNLAIYMHYLATADTLGEILEDKIGQAKSDPRLGTTPSEAASTTPSEAAVIGQVKLYSRLATLHFEILEKKIALEEIALAEMISLMKSGPNLGETPSEAASMYSAAF